MDDLELDLRDLPEKLRGDYPQPRCGICGRFAGRDSWGNWRFNCVWPNGDGGWEHD